MSEGTIEKSLGEMEAARKAFKVEYRKGGRTEPRNEDEFVTYGIDVSFFSGMAWSSRRDSSGKEWHLDKIEVHGDEDLRDRILELLRKDAE